MNAFCITPIYFYFFILSSFLSNPFIFGLFLLN